GASEALCAPSPRDARGLRGHLALAQRRGDAPGIARSVVHRPRRPSAMVPREPRERYAEDLRRGRRGPGVRRRSPRPGRPGRDGPGAGAGARGASRGRRPRAPRARGAPSHRRDQVGQPRIAVGVREGGVRPLAVRRERARVGRAKRSAGGDRRERLAREPSLMRVAVIGAGSIGQRHCRNLIALGHDVAVWDPDEERRGQAVAAGATTSRSLGELLETGPEAAVVCTPPAHHVDVAWEALDAGAHLFIEKPIAHASAGVAALLEEADRRGVQVGVGFTLRVLPSLRRVRDLLEGRRAGRVLAARAEFGGYLPAWRPGRDYRDNYAVSSALGGGILLDAIHELDYLG